MKTNIKVTGSNWSYVIGVDSETCGNPHMEAATKALEVLFSENDEFDAPTLEMWDDEEPNVGELMCTCDNSLPENEDNIRYVSTLSVAENASLTWLRDIIQKAEEEGAEAGEDEEAWKINS